MAQYYPSSLLCNNLCAETLPDCRATMPPTQRSRAWCLTINNPTEDDELAVREIDAAYLIFGREIGAEAQVPHLQGYIRFAQPKTLTAMKELFPRAHLEKAKGNDQQNRDYCTKDGEIFREHGTLSQQGKRTDLDRLADAIKGGERSRKVLRAEHASACARHPAFMEALLVDHRPRPPTPDITLRPWQVSCIDIVRQDPHPRHIHFFIDFEGGAGKSTFCTYLESLFENVQVMKPGRYQDMAYELEETVRILCFDCPRSRHDNIRYDFLEDVKDGRVTNSKYHSYQKRLGKVHVLVFCNDPPDHSKLSHDRVLDYTVSA